MMFRRALLLLAIAGLAGAAPGLHAQTAPSPPIRVIIEVPNDEAGRSFVKDRLTPSLPGAGSTAAPQVAPAPPPAMGVGAPADDISTFVAARLQGVRMRALALVEAAPRVPGDIRSAASAFNMMENRVDILWLVTAAALFVAGGFAAQRLVIWSSRSLLAWMIAAPAATV